MCSHTNEILNKNKIMHVTYIEGMMVCVTLMIVLSVIALTCQLQDLREPHNREKPDSTAAEAPGAPDHRLHPAPSAPRLGLRT